MVNRQVEESRFASPKRAALERRGVISRSGIFDTCVLRSLILQDVCLTRPIICAKRNVTIQKYVFT